MGVVVFIVKHPPLLMKMNKWALHIIINNSGSVASSLTSFLTR